jgi:predicted component of type VI protein secretion system
MAKLILSLDGLVLNEYLLTKERTSIGRKPHNDIQIDNLAVSGEHAVVVMVANDCFLEDLGSTNGTLVNGAPAKKHILRNNDVIELGKYKLMFVGQIPSPVAADYEQTMLWRPGAAKPVVDQARGMTAGQAGAQAKPAPAAPGVGPALARPAPAVPGAARPTPASRKSGWRIGLLLLVILIVGFLTYGMLG